MKSIKLLFLIVLVLMVSVCSVASANAELKDIPLIWKPTQTVSSLGAIDLTVFQKATFTVKPFNDLRKNPAEIGKNVEKRGTSQELPVTTKDNVAAWMTDKFEKILTEFGIDVVKSGGTFTLEVDIVKFYVTEAAVYKADVGLKIKMRTKSGDLIWDGMVTAGDKHWGASYKAENYYELLSNTCMDVVYNLLKSDSFLQAVQKNK